MQSPSPPLNGYNPAAAYPQPPNPTTDNEETPPTTSQQTQEPVRDPQTTKTASSNGNTEEDTSTQPGSSEGIDNTGTELKVPVTSETATDLPAILRPNEPTDIGLIIGLATVVIVVIILTILTVVIVVAILSKKHGKATTENEAVVITANQAGGLTHQNEAEVEESNIYNYPEFDLTNAAIETKQNEAYAANTAITTESNQAYAMSIITKVNAAYKSVNSDEIVDEYDYI